jgi:DNA-binding NarL/FixJ family response regulator
VKKIRVLVVDDSKMSYAMIRDVLSQSDFEICGFAQTASDAVVKYKELMPDVVTMDMNLPDYDGLKCSENILKENPDAKIVMISAMRDAKLMTRGRAVGISSFLGKPVKEDKLIHTLKSIVRPYDTKLEMYRDTYLKPFIDGLKHDLENLADLKSTIEVTVNSDDKISIKGIAVIIGLTGYPMGRIVFSVEHTTMFKLASLILGEDEYEVSEVEASECIEEMANIVSGRSVSVINDVLKEKELRITPPGTIMGNDMSIVNPKLTSFNIVAQTKIGSVTMNVGFAGGE